MSDLSGGCTGPCPPPPQLRLYQTIIFATPVLFALMLLLMFCLLYFRRQGRTGTSIQSHMRSQLFVEGLLAMVPPEQGLSRSFRQRLPITLYNDSFSSTCQDLQCAVCLGDYQPYEKLLHLPPCKHCFHLQCIDEWLAKHATCPICRTALNERTVAGAMHLTESSDASSMGILVTDRDESRFWEERVVGEAQDQDLPATVEGSEGESSDTMARHDQGLRPVVEHSIRIERS